MECRHCCMYRTAHIFTAEADVQKCQYTLNSASIDRHDGGMR